MFIYTCFCVENFRLGKMNPFKNSIQQAGVFFYFYSQLHELLTTYSLSRKRKYILTKFLIFEQIQCFIHTKL